MVRLSSTLPAYRSQDSTSVHRITYAVIRDLVVDETSGTVVDSKDQRRVDQGSASDGAGSGFDIPAILWLSFALAVGLYLAVGGMRLWRMTTAFAIGIVSAFCGMSSLSEGPWSSGSHDLQLAFSLGSDCKCRERGGSVRPNFDAHFVELFRDWVPRGSFQDVSSSRTDRFEYHRRDVGWDANCSDARGTALTLSSSELGHYRRLCSGRVRGDSAQAENRHRTHHSLKCTSWTTPNGMFLQALSCTFTGTFLLSIGVDLVVNKQNGVSRGLRHLLDGNDAHVLVCLFYPVINRSLSWIVCFRRCAVFHINP